MPRLFPAQEKALGETRNGSVVCGGVGSGKTYVAVGYFVRKVLGGDWDPYRKPTNVTDLYVITTARKRDDLDWQKTLAEFGFSTPGPSNGVGVVVDSWNNLRKYADVEGAFFVFDEQRAVGNGVWAKTFVRIARKNRWILLSATPGDTWMDYVPVFLAHGFYRNRSEFYERHVEFDRFSKYPRVKKYHGQARLRRLRDSLLVDVPVERHTRRVDLFKRPSYDVQSYDLLTKTRFDYDKGEPLKDAGALCLAQRKLVNSSEDRLDLVWQALERHHRVVVFYNFDFELAMLEGMAEAWEVEYAQYNGHEHEPVPSGSRWLYLVQYSSGAEAWNCTTTNCVLFYSLNYSYRVIEQCKGRIDRLNTAYRTMYYWFLVSDSGIDRAILEAINRKENFNETGYWKALKEV